MSEAASARIDSGMCEEPDLSQLQQNLQNWFHANGYESFSKFGNRHGSFETTFAKTEDDMLRYVSLDLTASSAPAVGQSTPYDLEVWIGGEKDERFSRRMIGQLSVTQEQLKSWELQQSIQALLKLAVDTVNRFRHSDLTAVYSRPPVPH